MEEIFGWMKTVGGMRKLRHRGLELVGWMFTFTDAAYNLVRIGLKMSFKRTPTHMWGLF